MATFEESLNEAIKQKQKEFNKSGKDTIFQVSPEIATILAFMWNILAISENRLDDLAYITESKTGSDRFKVLSVPLKKSSKKAAENVKIKTTKKSTKGKSAKKKK